MQKTQSEAKQKTQSEAKVSITDQLMKIGVVLAGATTGFAAPSLLKQVMPASTTPSSYTNALPALLVTAAGVAGYVYVENPTAKLFSLGVSAGAGLRSIQAVADGKISQLQGIGNVDVSEFQLEEGNDYDSNGGFDVEPADEMFSLPEYQSEGGVNGIHESYMDELEVLMPL